MKNSSGTPEGDFYLTGIPEKESEQYKSRPENHTSFYMIPIQRERARGRSIALGGVLVTLVVVYCWLKWGGM